MAGRTIETLAVNINGVNFSNITSFCYLESTFRGRRILVHIIRAARFVRIGFFWAIAHTGRHRTGGPHRTDRIFRS